MCRVVKAYPVDDGQIAGALRREIAKRGQMTEEEAVEFLENLPECRKVSIQEHVPKFSAVQSKRALKNLFRIDQGMVTATA